MKRFGLLVIIVVSFFPVSVFAQRGCCSWHGGVVGCGQNGKQLCADGTYSPSCTCTPPPIYGCTNPNAINYNSNANQDDGSCIARIYGCMDQNSINYNANANTADGSCQYEKIETRKEIIPYTTNRNDSTQVEIKQEGKNGEKEITERKILDENGTVLSTETIEEKVIEDPVEEIVIEVPDTDSSEEEEIETDNSGIVVLIILIILVIYGIYRHKKNKKTSQSSKN